MRMTRKALQKGAGTGAAHGFLDGQMLIASPGMQDERFSRSLIYMCAHSSEGAMGIIVNQPAPHISFPDLLVKLDVIPKADKIQLPPKAGDRSPYSNLRKLDLPVPFAPNTAQCSPECRSQFTSRSTAR